MNQAYDDHSKNFDHMNLTNNLTDLDNVYVFGGCNDDQCPTDTINKLNLKTKVWSEIGKMPLPRYGV